MVAASWINLLLLCIPLGVAAGLRGWNPTFVFTTVGGGGGRVGKWVLVPAAGGAAGIAAEQGQRGRQTSHQSQCMVYLGGVWAGNAAVWALLAYAVTVFNASSPFAPLAPLLQNFLSLIPLALILGEITEDLAVRYAVHAEHAVRAVLGTALQKRLPRAEH